MKRASGFTLVEMAIVLVIIGLLLGGLLMPLSAQVEQQRIAETQKYLEQAKEALIGFAAANGRLPCPASATSNGVESPAGGGVCTNPYDGFLPAATLGLTPTDSLGYAADAWGGPQNRIHYAVTRANSSAFTTGGGMQATGMGTLTPDLRVCSSAATITATQCSNPETTNVLTTNAVAVIYSVGKNAASGGTGADESANPNPNSANNDPVFVSRPPSASGAPGGEFDDIVAWLSPNILYSRLIAAQRLP